MINFFQLPTITFQPATVQTHNPETYNLLSVSMPPKKRRKKEHMRTVTANRVLAAKNVEETQQWETAEQESSNLRSTNDESDSSASDMESDEEDEIDLSLHIPATGTVQMIRLNFP